MNGPRSGAMVRPVGRDWQVLRGVFCNIAAGLLTMAIVAPSGLAQTAQTNPPAMVTDIANVFRLSPEEAERGSALQLTGVVTCVLPELSAFVIQQGDNGIYVMDGSLDATNPPAVGERVEIEGVTGIGVAKARVVNRLGAVHLPEPVSATWRQLLNGSLTARRVEFAGVVESMTHRANGWSRLNFRTRSGVLRVELRRAGVQPGPLENYADALIRLQGVIFNDYDASTGRLKAGQIRMHDVEVFVDQPAPGDFSGLPARSAAELMRAAPGQDAFERVKVSGQIVYIRGSDYFMMDGTDGVRFVAGPSELKVGDLVEVAGFPELSAAAPVLRSAVARKTGHEPLPAPKRLTPDELVRPRHDATLVVVDGLLASVRQTQTNLVLEMQAGSWRFLARLLEGASAVPPMRVGSRLELTGVYCAQGAYEALGEDVAPIDLYLNSPGDIKILSAPSWWTLRRLLVLVGALAVVLAGLALWVTQLRRQVEQRTAELGAQIREREDLEHQRAMEQERTRIAQDLHDELGSGMTEISMLAARANAASAPVEQRQQQLEHMAAKARQMVTALDEIVWAMNPRHDSLLSLVSYFCLYAERFLKLANIQWHFDGPERVPDHAVNSRLRHQLFLVFQEALTNVVRHSQANEVRFGVRVEDGELRFAVADNGRGFAPDERTTDMNGITNMRTRLEALGGRFELDTATDRGTTLRFAVPSP